ncbi:hypothetical protein GOODEAATRI_019478 [Goodea atripinnis]|uniref:NADH dehydrogenase subunit 5 n=1 Tax=Goodea atripinnis TaxID=208336 RepID=A0ABV0NBX5_9TELE
MNKFCFKPFHRSPGFMFRVVVLLESEPLPQSQVFADFNRFSSKIFLYLAPSIFSSTLTTFPVPAEEKHPQSMMLPPPYLTVGMMCAVLVLSHTARPKSSILVSSDLLWTSYGFLLTMASFLPLFHKDHICAVHD